MADAQTLWDYHQLGHELRPTDIAIGLGSHDIGVAEHTAALYHRGMFPLIVFTGANAPTTVDIFPRGEAVHFAERAVELGVPREAILQEAEATNTGENFKLTKRLLEAKGVHLQSATITSRPYQQRRAFATATKQWPGPEFICSSSPLPLNEYIARIGDESRVISMLVGDTQRIWVHAARGFACPQPIFPDVRSAYERLIDAGYTDRLIG